MDRFEDNLKRELVMTTALPIIIRGRGTIMDLTLFTGKTIIGSPPNYYGYYFFWYRAFIIILDYLIYMFGIQVLRKAMSTKKGFRKELEFFFHYHRRIRVANQFFFFQKRDWES